MKRSGKMAPFWIALGVLIGLAAARDRNPAAGPSAVPDQTAAITLTPDLSIGVEDGDENFIFGSIIRVDLDSSGNIYVLDYRYRVIRIFDQNGGFIRNIEVPAGQGPQEATNLSGIAVTPSGTLFVNDMRKVIVYGPDGKYLRTFLVDFMITSIGCPGTENLVAIGAHAGKILHVLDPAGKLLESFGDPFPVPKEFEAMREMPMFQAPILFNCAKDGHLFALNPHKYEISVLMDRHLKEVLKGKSDLFEEVHAKGRGFVSKAADIVRTGDLTFAVLSNPDPEAPKRAEIFRDGKQIGSMDFPGRPFCVDPQGRIYFAVIEDFPKVVRYAVGKE